MSNDLSTESKYLQLSNSATNVTELLMYFTEVMDALLQRSTNGCTPITSDDGGGYVCRNDITHGRYLNHHVQHHYTSAKGSYDQVVAKSGYDDNETNHGGYTVKTTKKCQNCGSTFKDVRSGNDDKVFFNIANGITSYECRYCVSCRTHVGDVTSAGKSSTKPITNTAELHPLTRRIAQYNRHYPTKKFVRSIKALMIEAHIDKYHAF